jgi:ketosteroid isomerase-like protein
VHPFPKAVESGDLDAVAALLADDVVFTSPVTFKQYPGKARAVHAVRAVWPGPG